MERSRILLIATILQSVTLQTMTFAATRSINGHGSPPSDHRRGGGRLLRQTQTAAIADWTSGFAADRRPPPPEIQRNHHHHHHRHRDLPASVRHETPSYSSGDWTPIVIPARHQLESQHNVADDRQPRPQPHRRPDESVAFVTLPPSEPVTLPPPPPPPPSSESVAFVTPPPSSESVAFVTLPSTAERHRNGYEAVSSGDGHNENSNIIIYFDSHRNHSQHLSNDQNGINFVTGNDDNGNNDRGPRPENAEAVVGTSVAAEADHSDEHAVIVVDEEKRTEEADPKQNAVLDVQDRVEKSPAGRPDRNKDGEEKDERRDAEKDVAAATGRRRNQLDRREIERRRIRRRRPVAAVAAVAETTDDAVVPAVQRRRKVQSSTAAAPRTERRTRRPSVVDNSRGERDNHGEYHRRGGSTTLNNDESIETTTRRQTSAAVIDKDENEDAEGQLRGGYGYGYTVLDEHSGMDFGQWEHREPGRLGTVTGQYRVRLPDGRTQTVEYSVSSDTGYKAFVSYDGVQHHQTPSVVAQHSSKDADDEPRWLSSD